MPFLTQCMEENDCGKDVKINFHKSVAGSGMSDTLLAALHSLVLPSDYNLNAESRICMGFINFGVMKFHYQCYLQRP